MTAEDIIGLLPVEESETLRALLKSGRSVDDALNSLVFMAVTLAIAAEVEPETFAANIRGSWRHIADQVNMATLHAEPAIGRA